MWMQLLTELLHSNQGKAIGVLAGLVFGLLVIIIGFLQTIFLAGCIWIGFIIGKRADDNESIREIVERIFREN